MALADYDATARATVRQFKHSERSLKFTARLLKDRNWSQAESFACADILEEI